MSLVSPQDDLDDTQASYIRQAENLEAEAQNLRKAVEQCVTESYRKMLTNKAVLLEVRAGRYRQKHTLANRSGLENKA